MSEKDPRSRSAKELAWVFVVEEQVIDQVLKGELQLPPNPPPPPATCGEIIAAYQRSHHELVAKVRQATEADCQKPIRFFVGPGRMGDVPKMQVMWAVLGLCAHGGRQGALDLRALGRRALDVALRRATARTVPTPGEVAHFHAAAITPSR